MAQQLILIEELYLALAAVALPSAAAPLVTPNPFCPAPAWGRLIHLHLAKRRAAQMKVDVSMATAPERKHGRSDDVNAAVRVVAFDVATGTAADARRGHDHQRANRHLATMDRW